MLEDTPLIEWILTSSRRIWEKSSLKNHHSPNLTLRWAMEVSEGRFLVRHGIQHVVSNTLITLMGNLTQMLEDTPLIEWILTSSPRIQPSVTNHISSYPSQPTQLSDIPTILKLHPIDPFHD